MVITELQLTNFSGGNGCFLEWTLWYGTLLSCFSTRNPPLIPKWTSLSQARADNLRPLKYSFSVEVKPSHNFSSVLANWKQRWKRRIQAKHTHTNTHTRKWNISSLSCLACLKYLQAVCSIKMIESGDPYSFLNLNRSWHVFPLFCTRMDSLASKVWQDKASVGYPAQGFWQFIIYYKN